MIKSAAIFVALAGVAVGKDQYLMAFGLIFFALVFFYQEPEKSAKK